MLFILNLAKTAKEVAEKGWTEAYKLYQKSPSIVIINTDAATHSLGTRSLPVSKDGPSEEGMRAAGSTPSAVSPIESISSADSENADENIEAEHDNIFMQPMSIESSDGREHLIEAEIDSGNRAEHMLIGKHVVEELHLQEIPLLKPEYLQGINGPEFRSVSFVRIKFRMPRLGLDWQNAIVHVVDCNVGFNIGQRAIMKWDLLSLLYNLQKELQNVKQTLPGHHYRGAAPSTNTVNALIDARSKAKKKEDARRHQANRSLATEIAAYQQQYYGPGGTQNAYAYSTGSSDHSSTAASTASRSHTSTWSTSDTCVCMESREQERKV